MIELVDTLGLPGVYDAHVHFLPPRVLAKVRAQFDAGGALIGRSWPLEYRGDEHELVEILRDLGVRRFSALPYAHKPGMAEYLNDWAADFAVRVPEALSSATLFPEPGVTSYVRRRIEAGTEIFKVHVQVGAFDVRDPLLDDAWGLLEDAGTPVVLHAGSGPVGTEFTGPEPVAGLLERHPALCLVMAHMGAPEYHEFIAMAERYDRVHLDTTMAFTDFFADAAAPYPADLMPRLADLGDKVLFGSDFPNIPYPWEHQVEALVRLDLGDDWLRRVLWDNAAALIG